MNLSRRKFVEVTVASTGCLLISYRLDLLTGQALAVEPVVDFAPNAWIRISKDNVITFLLDKTEMGQGTMTSLATIIAEEMNMNPALLNVEPAPAGDAYKSAEMGVQITGGSSSVRTSFEPLRRAGATVKDLMQRAAAAQWQVAADSLTVIDGSVMMTADKKVSFGALIEAAAKLTPTENPKLKNKSEFKYIGQSLTRLDALDKSLGQAEFGIDVRFPDTVVGVVIRPAAYGAAVKSFDADKAKGLAGVVDVVKISSGVAVVANSYWQASEAAKQVTVIWEKHRLDDLDTEKVYADFRNALKDSGKTFRSEGDVEKSFDTHKKHLEAEYEIPYMAHATMEPMNCTAYVQKDRCDIYAPTQGPGLAQVLASELTGLPFSQVHVHTTFMGGGFGRRIKQDFVEDAVEISMAVGRPVRTQMSREADMHNDVYRPGNFHRLKAAISADGKIDAWQHRMVGPSIMKQVVPEFAHAMMPEWTPLFVRNFAGWTGSKLISLSGEDATTMEGAADLAYDMPNFSAEWVANDPGIPIGFWRSVGHSYTGFVVESFIDELAVELKKDPLKMRLELLSKAPERKKVLEMVADKAGWDQPLPKNVFRGVAQTYAFKSYAAQVAEIEVNGDEIIVKRIVCVLDCGQVINPDQVKAQIESSVIFGLSAALKDPIEWANGKIQQNNFDDYRVLRMNESPLIESYLVDSDDAPRGVGEPAVPPVAAAVANAVFQATGKRLRKLPLRV